MILPEEASRRRLSWFKEAVRSTTEEGKGESLQITDQEEKILSDMSEGPIS